MIKIERVSDDVYVFTSDLYAQVTAGAIVSPVGTVLIDTLPFPVETLEIKEFIEGRLGSTVRYVVNTHYHADHTYGTCFFPDAHVVAHARCRELLDTRAREALATAKEDSADLAEIEIVLPDIIFDAGEVNIHLGAKTLTLAHSPGHSPDSTTVLIREDKILFAADTVMPLPFIADGDLNEMLASLEKILKLELENVVQGHGEVILRGEIASTVRSNMKYLKAIRRKVTTAMRRRNPLLALEKVDIESVGRSRIALGGVAPALHERNLLSLYEMMNGSAAATQKPKSAARKRSRKRAARKKTTRKSRAKTRASSRTNAKRRATSDKKKAHK